MELEFGKTLAGQLVLGVPSAVAVRHWLGLGSPAGVQMGVSRGRGRCWPLCRGPGGAVNLGVCVWPLTVAWASSQRDCLQRVCFKRPR